MNDYLLLVLQLALLGATGLLYFSFKRSQSRVTTSNLQAEEIVDLQSAMNELLDELQELTTRANLQLADTTAQAKELREEIDQRIEKLEELSKVFGQTGKIDKVEKPEEREPEHAVMVRLHEVSVSPKQEDQSEIGRGERELLHRLQNWQKN